WSNDPTFYVNFSLGSDDPLVSDGLAAGAGAFKTFQTAVDTIRTQVMGGQLQADCDSVYDQTVQIFGTSVGSHLAIAITGNPVTPSSCQFTKTDGGNIFDV